MALCLSRSLVSSAESTDAPERTVRKRAKHAKVRTGCQTCRQRHVKCDEARPACMACTQSRRVCAGYILPAPDRRAMHLRHLAPAILRPAPSQAVSLSGFESASFDFFRHITIHQLPQISWWQHIVLDLTRQEPALAHAAIALGSMSRALICPLQVPWHCFNSVQHDFAHQQYNKAVALIRRLIESHAKDSQRLSDSDTIIVQLSSLLFFCLEAYLGRNENAALHLRAGLRMLCEHLRKSDSTLPKDGDRLVKTTSSISSYQDALTYTFVLMDADYHMINEGEPYLETMCVEEMPAVFSSTKEAHVHLDSLAQQAEEAFAVLVEHACKYLEEHPDLASGMNEELQDLLLGCLTRIVPLGSDTTYLKLADRLRSNLRAWSTAWMAMPRKLGDECEHNLCSIFFFYIEYRAATWRDATESLADRFEPQFDYISNLAMQYLRLSQSSMQYVSVPSSDQGSTRVFSTPPLFSFGTGLAPTMCLIATKCRTSAIRHRCIDVIRSINLQGFFNTAHLAAYLDTITRMEVLRAKTLCGHLDDDAALAAHEIPEEARFFETMVLTSDVEAEFNSESQDPCVLSNAAAAGKMALAEVGDGSPSGIMIRVHSFP